MQPERRRALLAFCEKVGICFNDLSLLDLAFCHKSASNEGHTQNNERLEFLGDSVLSLVAADFLYRDMASSQEGVLSVVKAQAVSEETLAQVAASFSLGNLLVLGHGEELNNGRETPSILADCVESTIGAYYLDSGFEAAQKYILSFLVPHIRRIQASGSDNYKTRLQEYCQQNGFLCPTYKMTKSEGADNAKIFFMEVTVTHATSGKSLVFGPEKGRTKKKAEQLAAKIAYNSITNQQGQ